MLEKNTLRFTIQINKKKSSGCKGVNLLINEILSSYENLCNYISFLSGGLIVFNTDHVDNKNNFCYVFETYISSRNDLEISIKAISHVMIIIDKILNSNFDGNIIDDSNYNYFVKFIDSNFTKNNEPKDSSELANYFVDIIDIVNNGRNTCYIRLKNNKFTITKENTDSSDQLSLLDNSLENTSNANNEADETPLQEGFLEPLPSPQSESEELVLDSIEIINFGYNAKIVGRKGRVSYDLRIPDLDLWAKFRQAFMEAIGFPIKFVVSIHVKDDGKLIVIDIPAISS